jgi:DNA-directed RNA polymerase subunit RPC12/RpoP
MAGFWNMICSNCRSKIKIPIEAEDYDKHWHVRCDTCGTENETTIKVPPEEREQKIIPDDIKDIIQKIEAMVVNHPNIRNLVSELKDKGFTTDFRLSCTQITGVGSKVSEDGELKPGVLTTEDNVFLKNLKIRTE